MQEVYFKKVAKIAKYLYEIDEEILETFRKDIELYYEQDFSPRRTVEAIADQVFLAEDITK